MGQTNLCPQCGAEMPANSPSGMCPACLLKRGLETNTTGCGSQTSPRPQWTPPSVEELSRRFPELEIVCLIGRGGMGAVYQARQKNLDRLVALKILPPEMAQDAAFTERFTREARAMAKLGHPHIVTIHEFGHRDGWFYFLMEYVDGLTLRDLLGRGNITPREALAIVPQICEALQYAHDQGIVHRDIKPENILLNQQGQVKIADFGLAKLMGRSAPAVTSERVVGTPQYMAPEQFEHPADVDHRADIYSLGVVFYQMLTGELPLGKFEAPSRKVHIDVRLDEVVLRALEHEPRLRYQQASEVKTQVDTIVRTPAEFRKKSDRAAAQVRGPGIGLIATAILDWVIIAFVTAILFPSAGRWARTSFGSPLVITVVPLAVMAACAFMIYAALKIQQLESRWMGQVASVLAIFITPGNVIGLPVGIWALVVLARKDVREAFVDRTIPPTGSLAPWCQIVALLLGGITFTSPWAVRLTKLSALGFLGFLGVLGDLAPLLNGMRAFSAFYAFFGLIGIVAMLEFPAARRRARENRLSSKSDFAAGNTMLDNTSAGYPLRGRQSFILGAFVVLGGLVLLGYTLRTWVRMDSGPRLVIAQSSPGQTQGQSKTPEANATKNPIPDVFAVIIAQAIQRDVGRTLKASGASYDDLQVTAPRYWSDPFVVNYVGMIVLL